MPLDSDAKSRIQDHLQGRNNACPGCTSNNWTVFEDLVASVCIDAEYKRPIEGKYLPMVALICGECGQIRQIAAGPVGLL